MHVFIPHARVAGVLMTIVASATPCKGDAPAFASALLSPDAAWHASAGAPAATRDGFALGAGNPAVIASETRWRGSVHHLSWASAFSRERFALGGPLGARASVAIDVSALRPSNPLPTFDEFESRLGTMAPLEWSAGLRAATTVNAAWALGVGVRVHRLEDADSPIRGLGFSGGVRWRGPRRALGVSMVDVGRASGSEGRSYPLPRILRAGIEQNLGATSTVWLALERGSGGSSSLHTGFEYAPASWCALLAGASAASVTDETASLTLSGGFRLDAGRLRVSYAVRPEAELGLSHQVGFDLGLAAGTVRESP